MYTVMLDIHNVKEEELRDLVAGLQAVTFASGLKHVSIGFQEEENITFIPE